MPTWISRAAAGLACLGAAIAPARADIVTHLPPQTAKVIALTFDGCEAKAQPAWLDERIAGFLEAENIPATLFVTGLFARRNAQRLGQLARTGLVEIENHSWDHPRHLEHLPPAAIAAQLADTDAAIEAVTGSKPRFFRFPGGHYDAAALAAIEDSGRRVVHWSWESGDPARDLTPARLTSWVLSKARAGDVLIFHINGRAPATAAALPAMVAELKRRGFSFVRLDQVLK
jgi:peptidoglycan/xylan/chitin deacetylase (PgdA/CDA1 family)